MSQGSPSDTKGNSRLLAGLRVSRNPYNLLILDYNILAQDDCRSRSAQCSNTIAETVNLIERYSGYCSFYLYACYLTIINFRRVKALTRCPSILTVQCFENSDNFSDQVQMIIDFVEQIFGANAHKIHRCELSMLQPHTAE